MDRIFQWIWDRYARRYSWALCAVGFPASLLVCLVLSMPVVAFEGSSHYGEVAVVTFVAVLGRAYLVVLPGLREMRLVDQWGAGHGVDSTKVLVATYTYARRAVVRGIATDAVWCALFMATVGAVAGATGARLVQYAILGAGIGAAAMLVSVHGLVEAAFRPVRVAIAGDTGISDSLPRSRPTFATWTNLSMIATAFAFAASGAMLAAVFDPARQGPALAVVIGCALTLAIAIPVTVAFSFSPVLRPIRDLAVATERVAAGNYGRRVPVVQDDDLGVLAASFNRMQAGLAERQRLQAAFGTYVDPALAAQLLDQGDDIFTGERREVTVMFVDIRDFTPFAEANTAEDTVARLNALFEIVVPAVIEAGGHVNKFLGDGALAVFGAPNDLTDHADAAVSAAVRIHRLVDERFGGALRIGTGINTGLVIAGTIGGGGKLEFTLIGDTVNVAARVEQFTKITGDAILLTQQSVDALTARPAALTDRGAHALKGKSAAVQVFGLDPRADDVVGRSV
ncbi:adenylate/guanylate cyclase domain-containing protein [Nocardia sp. 348MFTsu5.1]|uniref:adenylate/guanylate cyclase domain-containing protein n=1 Tax=Nocardia sp. 348MFTsu5.1 TaxID=1172185 RepID=UPI0003A9B648|nr:adenylate/guanylate cyclase domain-containing protein [Nocardia sp. 348MFTsu5.1]